MNNAIDYTAWISYNEHDNISIHEVSKILASKLRGFCCHTDIKELLSYNLNKIREGIDQTRFTIDVQVAILVTDYQEFEEDLPTTWYIDVIKSKQMISHPVTDHAYVLSASTGHKVEALRYITCQPNYSSLSESETLYNMLNFEISKSILSIWNELVKC